MFTVRRGHVQVSEVTRQRLRGWEKHSATTRV